jgi:NAD(P)-dependent dehydrogenase (short-subunit alcohol dehydrogenase family)
MENLFDLSGKVAVITGSTKGIGRAIAQQMAFNGADVVISSRKEDACQSVADEINAGLDNSWSIALGRSLARLIFWSAMQPSIPITVP